MAPNGEEDIIKVVDIDHDGISEIVTGIGFMGQGHYSGEVNIVSVQGWSPNTLFKKALSDCTGFGWWGYLPRYSGSGCSFGEPSGVSFEFKDLDGDSVLDLIETVSHYEGFQEVSIEEGIKFHDCWGATNEFKDCWRKVKPETPVRDWREINLKEGKTINHYLFKNGNFVPTDAR